MLSIGTTVQTCSGSVHNWFPLIARPLKRSYIHRRIKEKKEQCVHSHTMSTCAWIKPPHRVQSAEITPAHSVGPRTHAYCTRQDMNICGVCARCAGLAALSDLQWEEIKEEWLRRRGIGARGRSEEKVHCQWLPPFQLLEIWRMSEFIWFRKQSWENSSKMMIKVRRAKLFGLVGNTIALRI